MKNIIETKKHRYIALVTHRTTYVLNNKKIEIRNTIIIKKHRYIAVVTQSSLSEGRRNHCARRLRDGAARSDLGRLRCPGLVAIRFVTGTVSTPFDDVTVVLVAAWRGRYATNDATWASLSSADILCHTESATTKFPNGGVTSKLP